MFALAVANPLAGAHVIVHNQNKKRRINASFFILSERRDSNPRPLPWQGSILATELLSRVFCQETAYNKRMSPYSEFQTQSNKVLARAAEQGLTKGIMYALDIFKAVFGFLKQMLFSFLGK